MVNSNNPMCILLAGNLESLPSGLILPRAWARPYKTFDRLQLLRCWDAFRTKVKKLFGTVTWNACDAHLWKSDVSICNCTDTGYISSAVCILKVNLLASEMSVVEGSIVCMFCYWPASSSLIVYPLWPWWCGLLHLLVHLHVPAPAPFQKNSAQLLLEYNIASWVVSWSSVGMLHLRKEDT